MSEDTIEPTKRIRRTKAQIEADNAATTIGSAAGVAGGASASANATAENRVFAKQVTYTHDLYKLLLSSFKKNVEVDGRQPRYEDNEHVHWFHTIDSDGKTQTYCNPVGGHFHKMKVTHQGPGKAPLVECVSGPLRKVAKKNEWGQWITEMVPFNPVDHHTHDTQYIGSGEIKPRQRNVEAAIYATTIEQKTAHIPGVEG